MLEDVGWHIAGVAPLPNARWEFVLFDQPDQANASCLSGGKVGVHTGMLPIRFEKLQPLRPRQGPCLFAGGELALFQLVTSTAEMEFTDIARQKRCKRLFQDPSSRRLASSVLLDFGQKGVYASYVLYAINQILFTNIFAIVGGLDVWRLANEKAEQWLNLIPGTSLNVQGRR